MGKIVNYAMIKDFCEGDEVKIASYLYKHYYYIIDKYLARNKGIISKEELEDSLIKVISEYVCKENYNCNPSKYIHSFFDNFEKKRQNHYKREKSNLLLEKAYTDESARKELFLSVIDTVDKKGFEIYNDYLNYLKKNNNFSRNQVLITIDDIKQMMYLEVWNFFNQFFSNDNRDKYFRMYFSSALCGICNKVNNYMYNLISDNSIISIDNVYYNNSFVNRIETGEILDIISEELPDKFKLILGYLRQGYTYEYAGSQVGLTRSRANHINKKIKKIVYEKKIEI